MDNITKDILTKMTYAIEDLCEKVRCGDILHFEDVKDSLKSIRITIESEDNE